ncbi:MAG: methylmalonyl Co-A mutase-associated GTPase MeaB [Flavobacteriaceae bacterium]|nr:methylmalonyl Co-A mutase-associated GTPase MeaB [Flavobacteriaceae bacterium]
MIQKSNFKKSIKNKNAKTITASQYLKEILNGNISYLSRAITLIESTNKNDKVKATNLIKSCLAYTNNSIRIGITGAPGVGKSTFIEALGTLLTSLNKKVAVLAIDPSSSVHKGSILGDKTRMDNLVNDKNAFIRPSPAGDSLGGVAHKTKEAIILCEAAGYDIILIETVGVGQSEVLVKSMVDFFLLLKISGAGDELQGIKRGIIEMADAIVINKADGENVKSANFAKNEFSRALHLYPQKENHWIPKVTTCSALNNHGIEEVWQIVLAFVQLTKSNNWFKNNRVNQNKNWLIQSINQQLQDDFYTHKKIKIELKKQIQNIENHESTPFEATQKLIALYRKK